MRDADISSYASVVAARILLLSSRMSADCAGIPSINFADHAVMRQQGVVRLVTCGSRV